jgi:hypothetical protein
VTGLPRKPKIIQASDGTFYSYRVKSISIGNIGIIIAHDWQ